MSELLRVLSDGDVDDDALQEAAAAAHAVLEARGVGVEGVAPVLHAGAREAGQRAIDDVVERRRRSTANRTSSDDAVAGDEPSHELIVSPVNGDTRRYRVGPNPDPGAPYLLTEAEWTGCAWRHSGTEALDRVEIDGDVWHEADTDGVVEPEAGP